MFDIAFSQDFLSMLLRFFICVAVNWVIVDRMYYRKSKRRDFYFTFILMTITIFFLVFFMMGMDRGKATMGVGLGLFGIFSIMRYRTDAMPVREMTYLFLIVCLAVVHAMAGNMEETYGPVELEVTLGNLVQLLVVDIIVMAAIYLCELKLPVQYTKIIQYDRIALITPDKREELIADLQERTGLQIDKVEVGAIDFLRDMAVVKIYYKPAAGENGNTVDNFIKLRRADLSNV